MNHTKLLIGAILFATAHTFTMNQEENTDDSSSYPDMIYKLHCGLCNRFVRESIEDKRIFHAECMKLLASSAYVTEHPATATKPWLENNSQADSSSNQEKSPSKKKGNWAPWKKYKKK